MSDGSSPTVLERGASMGMGADRDVKVRFQKFGGDFIKKVI
jgi:hypothetical protein